MNHAKVLPPGSKPIEIPRPAHYWFLLTSSVPVTKTAAYVGRRLLAGHRPHPHQPEPEASQPGTELERLWSELYSVLGKCKELCRPEAPLGAHLLEIRVVHTARKPGWQLPAHTSPECLSVAAVSCNLTSACYLETPPETPTALPPCGSSFLIGLLCLLPVAA